MSAMSAATRRRRCFQTHATAPPPKTVSSQVGDIELAVPRDRNGTFTPQLVPKGARRLGGLDEMSRTITSGDQS
jgi:putative transposase